MRNRKRDHMGIAVMGVEGMRVLHCQRGAGVTHDSAADLLASGYRSLEWLRHKDLDRETALCRA